MGGGGGGGGRVEVGILSAKSSLFSIQNMEVCTYCSSHNLESSPDRALYLSQTISHKVVQTCFHRRQKATEASKQSNYLFYNCIEWYLHVQLFLSNTAQWFTLSL